MSKPSKPPGAEEVIDDIISRSAELCGHVLMILNQLPDAVEKDRLRDEVQAQARAALKLVGLAQEVRIDSLVRSSNEARKRYIRACKKGKLGYAAVLLPAHRRAERALRLAMAAARKRGRWSAFTDLDQVRRDALLGMKPDAMMLRLDAEEVDYLQKSKAAMKARVTPASGSVAQLDSIGELFADLKAQHGYLNGKKPSANGNGGAK